MSDLVHDNLEYYNTHADAFYEGTVHADVSGLYGEFLPFLPQGGHILDFGCGSGRDSLYFINQGYKVTALDGSEKLCELASRLTGQLVKCQDFYDFNDQEKYDGIWACASLLHIPEKHLPEIIKKLYNALLPNGVLYASFKYGSGERQHNQRHFTDLDKVSIQDLFKPEIGFTILKLWMTTDVRQNRQTEKWINVIARKTEKF